MTFQPQLSADQRINVVRIEGTSVADQLRAPDGYTGPPKATGTKSAAARRRRRAKEIAKRRTLELDAAERRELRDTRTIDAQTSGPDIVTGQMVTNAPSRSSSLGGIATAASRTGATAAAIKETAEQKADDRTFFTDVRERVDAGVYNVATFRPSSIIVPDNVAEAFLPVLRAPMADYIKGFATGARNPEPERTLGDAPDWRDYTSAELIVEGIGGVLAGAATGSGGAVKDAYIDPVGNAISDKLRGVISARREDAAARRAAKRELAIQARFGGEVADPSLLDRVRGLSPDGGILGADPVNLSSGPAAAQEEARNKKAPPKAVKLSRAQEVRHGVGVGGSYGGIVAPASDYDQDTQRGEDSAAHTFATGAAALLGSVVAGGSVAAARVKGRLKGASAPRPVTMPAVIIPPPALPVQSGASMLPPTLGVPDASSIGSLGPTSLMDRAQDFYAANQAAVLGSAAALAGVALVGGTVAAVAAASEPRTTTRRASTTRKSSSTRKSATAKKSKRKNVREDRRGVTRNTYRGQRVYTHKGRHYVIRKRKEGNMPAGTWKFINS